METMEPLSPIMANLQQAEFWAKQAAFWANQAQASVTQVVYDEEDDYDEDDDYDEPDGYDEDDDETPINNFIEYIIDAAQTQKQDIERCLADLVEREYKLKMELVSANETDSEKIMAKLSFIVAESDNLITEKARVEKILNFLATA